MGPWEPKHMPSDINNSCVIVVCGAKQNFVAPSTNKRQFVTTCSMHMCYIQGLEFDDMSSFFPCEIDDATWIWRAESKNSYFIVHFFRHFVLF